MAARLHARHQREIREKIQASNLLAFLQKFVETGKDAQQNEVNPARVTAALGLLKKCIPDLSSVEHSGEVEHRYVAEVPAVIPDADEWSKQHTPPSLQ